MRIKNTSNRDQHIAGVGHWEPDGVVEIFDEAVIKGILKNPWFEVDAEQYPDVDPAIPESPAPESDPDLVAAGEMAPPDTAAQSQEETPLETAEVADEGLTPRMARARVV